MSYSVAQIQQQNLEFERARASGQISQAQYDQAMAIQNANMAKVQVNQQNPYQTSTPHLYEPAPTPTTVPQKKPQPNVFDELGSVFVDAGKAVSSIGKIPSMPLQNKLAPQAPNPVSTKNIEQRYNSPAMQKTIIPTIEVVGITGGAILAPQIVIPSILIGEGANIGINSAFKSVSSGKAQVVLPKSAREVLDVAAESALFGVVSTGVIGGVAKVAPRLAGEVANPLVRAATRIGINSGLGAGASAILSKGDPTAIAEGAAFGAAFGALGEGINAVARRIVPSKSYVTRITEGSSEGITSEQIGEIELIESSRQFKIETTTEKISDASYAKFLKEQIAEHPPKIIEFEGETKTNYILGETMETKVGADSFKGPAEPFIAASKNEPFVAHLEDLGLEENIIASNHKVSISQTREGIFLDAAERAALKTGNIDSKVVVTSSQFHDVKLWSEITPEDYTNMLSKMKTYIQPDLVVSKKGAMKPFDLPFKQMGGLSSAQLETPELIKVPKINVFTDILDVTTVKPQINIPIGLSVTSLPKIRSAPKATVSSTPLISIQQPKPKQNILPTFKQPTITKPQEIPALTSFNIPRQTSRIMPEQIPRLSPLQTPKVTPKQTQNTALTFDMPKMQKTTHQNFPGLGFGGGFGESRGQGAFNSKWFLKTHKNKTYSQMLKTFGLGKASKPMRNIEKATNKLVKSFKGNRANKNRRHRKR